MKSKFFSFFVVLLMSNFIFCQNNGLRLDGIDDYIDIPTLNCPTSFTFEAYIKWNGITVGYETILEFGNDSPYFGINGTSNLLLFGAATDPSAFPIDIWTHVAVTYDELSNESVLYVNGIIVATSTNPINTTGISSGIGFHDGDNPFGGVLDEVRIWDDIRTQTEIANNMCDLPSYLSEPNLLAYYKFDQTSGTTLNDLTGAFHGNLTNMTGTEWESGACVIHPLGVDETMVAWFKPDAIYSDNGITPSLNNDVFQQWNDVSGNTNNVTQVINANKPTYHDADASNNFNPYATGDGNDFIYRTDLLPANSNGSVYYAGRSTSNSGYHTAVGFGQSNGISPNTNDGDDPLIGINGSSFTIYHDWGVPGGSASYSFTPLTQNTNSTYTYGLKWINGASGIDYRMNALSEHSTTVSIMAGSVGEYFSIVGPFGGVQEHWEGNLPEVLVYDVSHSAESSDKIESYLAIKYGITLGHNGISLNYYNTNYDVIWDATVNLGYAYDVAGIERDDIAVLAQNKSHSTNTVGTDFRDIVTISNGTNFISPASFANDYSSFVWGHNGGILNNTNVIVNILTENGENMETILSRHWKGQESGTVNDVTLEFDLNNIVGQGNVLGANDLVNLRLLVDEDGDFTSGARSYSPSSFSNTSNLAYFEHDFIDGDGSGNGFYFTLASTNHNATPLPIDLGLVDVDCYEIKWTVNSEINNSHYEVQTSRDLSQFQTVNIVQSIGDHNSTYSYASELSDREVKYVRIKQVDLNGNESLYGPYSVWCNENTEVDVYPNPAGQFFNVKIASFDEKSVELKLVDNAGKIVWISEHTNNKHLVSTMNIESGLYTLIVSDNFKAKSVKVSIIK